MLQPLGKIRPPAFVPLSGAFASTVRNAPQSLERFENRFSIGGSTALRVKPLEEYYAERDMKIKAAGSPGRITTSLATKNGSPGRITTSLATKNSSKIKFSSKSSSSKNELPRDSPSLPRDSPCHENSAALSPRNVETFHLPAPIKIFLRLLTAPIEPLIELTCPDCRILQPNESLYFVTFVASFLWISFFSYFITIVVDNIVNKDLGDLENATAFFGIVLIAVGAEVPDTVNSCTVAARGYGSMSTSSCIGSQITNICLGVGLSWTLAALFEDGATVTLGKGDSLVKVVAWVQLFNVAVFYGATVGLGFGRRKGGKEENIVLTKGHVKIFVAMYIMWIAGFTVLTFGY